MVRLKCSLHINSRMIDAGEEVNLPQALEAALLLAGNAEPVSFAEIPAVPAPPSVDEGISAPAEAIDSDPEPSPAEDIPQEPEKPLRRYGR